MIKVLSLVLAFNVAVALATVYVRSDGLSGGWDQKRVAAGTVEAPSPLAAGNFSSRRSPRATTSSTAAPGTTTGTASFVMPQVPMTDATTASAPPITRPSGRRSQERTRPSTPTTTARPAATTTRPAAKPAKPAVTTTRPAAAAAAAPRVAERPGSLSDPVGDTFVAETDEALTESRADIIRAAATYEADGVAFVMQLDRPSDPREDERWAGNSTFALWHVDTNSDTLADYEVHYFRVDDENVGGYVSKPGPDSPALCGLASASYDATGYKATVDPACLGNPASFTFRASTSYDTNPADESASIAGDIAPNKGWSAAITRSAG